MKTKHSLSKQTKKRVRIIGAPMDLGQSRRGVDMGPSAIRYAGLFQRLREIGYDIEDIGNIDISIRDSLPKNRNLLIAIQDACGLLYETAKKAMSEECLPIFLGGDHSISIGTIGGLTHESRIGVIWADAHGDFNIPETSPTQNVHGMALSVLLGNGFPKLVGLGREGAKLDPEDVVLIGVRQLDPQERIMLRQSKIRIYTMRDIDERGMGSIAREALHHLQDLSHIHISLDMDCLDPMQAPGVGSPVSGGLTYREAHLMMEILADSGRIGSMDIVEINPILDHCNRTAQIAVELAASLLGQRIL